MRGLAVGREAGAADWTARCRLSGLSDFVVLVTKFEAGWRQVFVGHCALHSPAVIPGSADAKDSAKLETM